MALLYARWMPERGTKSKQSDGTRMLFDTHAHVLSADREAYPFGTLRGGAKVPVPAMVFPVEELVRQMDLQGVDKACLVQRATLYGYDNSYALDAAAQFPERFAAVAVLDAEDANSQDELRRLTAGHRLGGVRIVAPGLTKEDTSWLDGPEALGFWATAEELGLPVTVILYWSNNLYGRAALLGLAQRFSVPMLLDHTALPHPSNPEKRIWEGEGYDVSIPGGPDFGIGELLAGFDDLPHVHFKVTDINFDRLEDAEFDSAKFVRALADRFGADRLIWGSDVGQSPAPYAEKVERLHHSGTLLSDEERAAFFGGNAERIYAKAFA
jgi:predicted TIM-barrel fold metal-dependent hydrolase